MIRHYAFSQLIEEYNNSLDDKDDRLSPSMVRRYLQAGLLPRPSTGGKGAKYFPEHLDRLAVIRILRDQAPSRTTLKQIRAILDQLTPPVIQGIADGSIPFKLVDDNRDDVRVMSVQAQAPSDFEEWDPKNKPRVSRDLDPLSITPPAEDRMADVNMAINVGRAKEDPNVFPWLLAIHNALNEHVDPKQVRQVTSTEEWHKIRVGSDDIEISVKGPVLPEHLTLLKTIGDLLQQIIFHGSTKTSYPQPPHTQKGNP